MTRQRRTFLSSLRSRFIAVYMIVMAPIAALASYYQYSILSDRHQAREVTALDTLEGAFAPVTSTLVQTDLLLGLLGELTNRGLSGGDDCDLVIDAIVKARFSVAAAGIYTSDGQAVCSQGILRSGMVADAGSAQPPQSPFIRLTDSDLFVTKAVSGQIIAIEADLPKVELPEIAMGYGIVSRTSPPDAAANQPAYQTLGNRLAPDARDILRGESEGDVAILPVAAFGLRPVATLARGVAAPPLWLTIINASFVPLVLLTLSLLLADMLIRKMALNDITRLTHDMRAFRQDRDLPKGGLGPWTSEETAKMQVEFSALSDQLLHEEAEAQNRLHNANILQREIFHRVGNNLQIIQSILRLYASDVSTSEEKALIERLASRIRIINLVHAAMHRSVDAPFLPAGQALSRLIQDLRHEGVIAENIEIKERFQDVELRVNRVYALCYLLVEKLIRLSRSGARYVQISLREDGDRALLAIKADIGHLAPPNPVSARLRQVYTHELRATARWHEGEDTVTYEAVMPRKVR